MQRICINIGNDATFHKAHSGQQQKYLNTVEPILFADFEFFFKIRENQTPEKLPNSMTIVEKTREPRTLDPAEFYKAADCEK